MTNNSPRVSVDAGALQMVRNALQRDAQEGKASRAEMLEALDATIQPMESSPSEAQRKIRQDALQKLQEALGLPEADEVIAMLNASVRIRRLTEELIELREKF